MPAGNFDDVLTIGENGVVNASGPFDASVAVVTEMCVWVTQRDGADDAIANNMAMPDMPGMPSDLKVTGLRTPGARWMFPLKRGEFKDVDFSEGSASAMAVGVFQDEHGTQRAFFWSETVELSSSGETEDC